MIVFYFAFLIRFEYCTHEFNPNAVGIWRIPNQNWRPDNDFGDILKFIDSKIFSRKTLEVKRMKESLPKRWGLTERINYDYDFY